MAVINPPNLYTGGAVIFDSSPSVNMYGNLLARKQAKMDALDEYDRHRINNINPNGVRDQDREGLDQRINQLRLYYSKNKDRIRKGNSAESFEYEKMFRNVGSYINQSKERTAKQEAAMKFYQDKLKQDGVVPEDFITEIEVNDKSLDSPDSQTFNLTKWLSTPKPFNQQTFLKGFSDVKRTPSVRTEPIKDQPLRLNEITEETFDTGGKQVIANRAAERYENSYSFRSQVQNEIKDPIARARMEQTFREQYGTNPQLPEDYATAFTLELLQPKITKSKAIDNKDAIMTRREQFAREIQGRIDRRAFSLAAQRRNWQMQDEKTKNDYVQAVIDAYKKSGKVDPDIVGDYTKKDDKGHAVEITETVFSPDGKTVDFVVKDANGKVYEDYSTRGVPVGTIETKVRTILDLPKTTTTTGNKPTAPKKKVYNPKTGKFE